MGERTVNERCWDAAREAALHLTEHLVFHEQRIASLAIALAEAWAEAERWGALVAAERGEK